jgi:hypothetical protein
MNRRYHSPVYVDFSQDTYDGWSAGLSSRVKCQCRRSTSDERSRYFFRSQCDGAPGFVVANIMLPGTLSLASA